MRKLFFLLLFFGCVQVSFTQSVAYQFAHVSTTEGLSQSSAIAIHQDNLGQMWIGTRDGLNKYDGSKFTVYRSEIDNPYSLSNNDILAIEEDSDGFIWVGTYNGLNKYNPKTNTFTRYFHEDNNESLSNNTVWAIKELSNKEIWIGTSNGLSIFNKKTQTFQNCVKTNTKSSIVGNHILSIIETNNKNIFVGTTTGLSEYVKTENGILQFKNINHSEDLYIQDLIETKSKTLLIATKSKSVLEYNPDNKRISSYFNQDKLNSDQKNVRQLLFDDKEQLWVGTYSGIQIANTKKEITLLQSDINDSNSLSKNSIKNLYKDKRGSIWIGTYYGGVNIWDESNINFFNITYNQNKKGLNYSVVSSIASHKDYIYFGTEGGGITIYNKQQRSYNYITQNNTAHFPDNNIKSLLVTNNDKLWIGTFNNGIVVYNLNSKKIEDNVLSLSLKTYLNQVGVYTITQYDNENILIGTFGKGLIKYNLKTKIVKTIDYLSGGAKSLSSNLVRAVIVDKSKNLWVATSKGLNRIDTNGFVTTYFYDANRQYGEDILCILQDSSNIIWVGTKANGLFKLEGSSFVPIKLSNNEFVVSSVRSILEDKTSLWIGANQGIIRYDIKTKKTDFYNKKDGVVSNEFNDNACLKINNSQFYFGSPVGVTHFNSSRLSKNNYAPQVILTEFAIKNKSVNTLANKNVLKETLPFTKSIALSHDQGNFSIAFAIPSFINALNNSYQYRLKGLEQEWNYTSINNASYTIQNSGQYIFEVKGANSDGIWNTTTTQLLIKVAPAPWRSWWAFSIYALLILTCLFLLKNILKSKTKLQHQLALEYLETQRTKEVNKIKLEFFTNISHEFRTPLALILGPLQQIIEDFTGSNKVYKKLLVVENSANHLLQLINRLMDFRKLENNLYKLETAEGNIIKFLKEIYLSFSEFAKQGGYAYTFKTSDQEILVYYDRSKLERVFYNLISNAFRYTPKGGKIEVYVKEQNNKVIIEVRDTGVGIAEEYKNKIFERFFEVAINNKPENDYNKGTGIGLSIAKNIVNLHKGEIFVEGNENQEGSIFSVELPLGRKHLKDDEIIQDFKFSDDVSQYVNQLETPSVTVMDDDLAVIPSTNKQTILIVEDHKPLRKFLKSILKTDYNILESENGKIAFKTAKKEVPDLIISDVVMPIMAGTELCALIKQDLKTSHIPIILLTSRSSLVYKLEGLEHGADDYISKPFNVNEFKVRVKNLLASTARLKEKFSSNNLFKPNKVVLSSVDEILYEKAFKIVETNIGNEDFDIQSFCLELGVSRTMLFTKIKAWSNFTPNEFIQHFKMQRAAQLLEQGKIDISQVAYSVGFKDRKYFSKCFQKKFGKSPSEYANKFSED